MRKAHCPTETRYYSSRRGWMLISYGRVLIAFGNYLIRARRVLLNPRAQCANPNKYVSTVRRVFSNLLQVRRICNYNIIQSLF